METALHRTRPPRHSITSFVGRRREIDEARARLQQSRLVSLLGPGGVGKTRLAEEIAERSARAFRDSYRWIDLSSVRDPEALPSLAARALGVIDQSNRDTMAKILDYLRDKQVLIVLDNCEHLLQASSQFVASVLADAPQAHILATSREPLGVGGEAVFDLPPLSTPPAASGYRAVDVAVFESVALLVERAQSIVAGFELSDSNADALAELCLQLDGIPLAIELAAVRLRSLSATQLIQRLDHRFALLTGGDRSSMPRQQTLKALIDWSYDLCSDAERTLWARLSVFSGSFDLDAAEHICSCGTLTKESVIQLLDGLVAKSLVRVDRTAEELRYTQLMTVREYGHDLLEAGGDSEAVYRLHRDHYLQQAQKSADDWFSPRQSELLGMLRVDHFNLISALDWSLRAHDVTAASALSVALRYHWIAGGYLSDGRLRLERLLTHLDADDETRGDVLWVTAWTALIQGDRDGASSHLNECADIAARLGDTRLQAHHDHWAGLHALFSGRTTDAITLIDRALEVHRERNDGASVLTASFMLAMAQAYDGQLDQALATCRERSHRRRRARRAVEQSLCLVGIERRRVSSRPHRESNSRRTEGLEHSARLQRQDLHSTIHRSSRLVCASRRTNRTCRATIRGSRIGMATPGNIGSSFRAPHRKRFDGVDERRPPRHAGRHLRPLPKVIDRLVHRRRGRIGSGGDRKRRK